MDEIISRFHKLNLDAKQANLEATCATNEIFEGLIKEVRDLHKQIDDLTNELSDANEEIEQQVEIIVNQRDEINGVERPRASRA